MHPVREAGFRLGLGRLGDAQSAGGAGADSPQHIDYTYVSIFFSIFGNIFYLNRLWLRHIMTLAA